MDKGRITRIITRVPSLIAGFILLVLAWPIYVRADISDTVLLSVTIDNSPPATIPDLTSSAGILEGTVGLSWTSPRENSDGTGGKVSSYTVKYATFSVASLAGDTTAWWQHPNTVVGLDIPSFMIHDPGTVETNAIAALEPGVTYYYGIRSEDAAHNISDYDAKMPAVQAFASAADICPAAPSGFVLVSQSTRAVSLAWDNMSGSAGYGDFDYFAVYRSSTGASPGIISTTTLSSYIDTAVMPETTYYYIIRAFDTGPSVLVSDSSTIVQACTTLPPIPVDYKGNTPRAPSGIRLDMTNTTRTIRWSRILKNMDNTPYTNSMGYKVYRSVDSVGGWTQLGFVIGETDAACAWTDATPLVGTFYYKVRGITTSNVESPDSMLCDTAFNVLAVADDQTAIVSMPDSINSVLYKGQGYKEDINITVGTRNEKPAPGAISVYEVAARDSQTDEKINTFHFPTSKAKMVYFFDETNKGTSQAVNRNPAIDINNISFFWFNGVEWVKMSSVKEGNTVIMYTSRLGKYMVKESLKATTFNLTRVYPQTFTPNGDNRNDHVEFQFENPQDANPSGKIFDMHGAVVAELKKGLNYDSLVWDGTTVGGAIAAPGAYIYQIEVTGSESKIINGVVVVAK